MNDSAIVDTSRLRGGRGVRNRPKGRHVDADALADVRALLGDAPRERSLLIEFLHRIQDARGYLPASHLVALAQEMRLAMTEVYEVATFYHHFDVVDAKRSAAAADNGARVRNAVLPDGGGARVARRAASRMATATCACSALRASAAASRRRQPSSAAIRSIARRCRASWKRSKRAPSNRRRRRTSISPRIAATAAIGRSRECVDGARDVESVIAELENSALRGLGGAGFPAGRKWRIVRAEPAPRLMAVNIDEGEPGTFKDRYYLERDPHRFLEGMLIAAWAVGIDAIYIYLRDEYAACRALLTRELEALTRDPPCALPRIHLRRGAGAYICGEESAMIESIEGKRGMPRLRPPYVAQVGPLRPPDARAQHGNAVLGARHPRARRELVRRAGTQRPQGPALVLGIGPRRQAGRAPRARPASRCAS